MLKKILAALGIGLATKRRKLWYAGIAILAVCWMATATWGRADVTASAHSMFASWPYEFDRLDFDPETEDRPRKPKMPWYYVGRSTSPAPFVVAIDIAEKTAPLSGHRATYYFLWFFGLKYSFYQDLKWFS